MDGSEIPKFVPRLARGHAGRTLDELAAISREAIRTLHDLRRLKRDEILRIAEMYGARNVRVFGSWARGDTSPSSDIDFLVDLDPDRTLMDLGGLLTDLQDMLGMRVDVATPDLLRAKVRKTH